MGIKRLAKMGAEMPALAEKEDWLHPEGDDPPYDAEDKSTDVEVEVSESRLSREKS